MGNVIDLNLFEVYAFPWGSAVKRRKGSWTHIFIGNQELFVEEMKIVLHDNGIEFL
jgi:hypothetical protein